MWFAAGLENKGLDEAKALSAEPATSNDNVNAQRISEHLCKFIIIKFSLDGSPKSADASAILNNFVDNLAQNRGQFPK